MDRASWAGLRDYIVPLCVYVCVRGGGGGGAVLGVISCSQSVLSCLPFAAPPSAHCCPSPCVPSQVKQRCNSEGAFLDEGRAASDLADKLFYLDGFEKSVVAKHLSMR